MTVKERKNSEKIALVIAIIGGIVAIVVALIQRPNKSEAPPIKIDTTNVRPSSANTLTPTVYSQSVSNVSGTVIQIQESSHNDINTPNKNDTSRK